MLSGLVDAPLRNAAARPRPPSPALRAHVRRRSPWMGLQGKRRRLLPVLIAVLVSLLAPARLAVANWDEGEDALLATLAEPAVVESSGLVASRDQPGVIWTHNDSGDDARLYATNRNGRALGTFLVPNAANGDWEDLALGPGDDGGDALYVADTGDNTRRRDDAAIYRIPEPRLHPVTAATGEDAVTAPAARFPIVYPDGPRDVEALLVHPETGETLLVTKESIGPAAVYEVPPFAEPDRTVRATFLTDLALPGVGPLAAATGGAVAPDGGRLVLRTPLVAMEWAVVPGQTLADALLGEPRRITLPATLRGEALTYRDDGAALLLTAEGSPCPLYRVPLDPAGRSRLT